ncbi:hypothetical protein [Leptospira yasudae]|uniref:Uncharacterized protein n=1 Tax=Leptospira yasudae TaxID=2202201 RepID=A0ABX9M1Z3_9LEPT|nr:hypothetical protein [Leptospira yasudae]RHX78708.1 hypothetical protein DLM77_16670 [Leptospira yasudae]
MNEDKNQRAKNGWIYGFATPLIALLLIDTAEVLAFQSFPNLRLGGFTERSILFGYRKTLGIDWQFPYANMLLTAVVWGVGSLIVFFFMTHILGPIRKLPIFFAISLLIVLLYLLYCLGMDIQFAFRIFCLFAAMVSAMAGASGAFLYKYIRSRIKTKR